MDVSSVISASTIQSGLYATNSTPSIASLLNTTATTALTSAVDISGLGQLLSASAIFESGLLKAAATNQASFSTVTAAIQLFVQAFNNFVQSDTMQSSSAVFMQVLNAQSSSVSGASVISNLADLGITYQAATSVNDTGQMSVDYTALQSAFNADQSGTVALLANTTKTVGQLASEFTSLLAQSDVLTINAQSAVNSATLNGLLEAGVSSSTTSSSAAEAIGGRQSSVATQGSDASVTISVAGLAASAAQTAGATMPASVVPTAAESAAVMASATVSTAVSSVAAISTTESTAASTAAASTTASTTASSSTTSSATIASTASATVVPETATAAASESGILAAALTVSEAVTAASVSASTPLISTAVNESLVPSAAGVAAEGLAASPIITRESGAATGVLLAQSANVTMAGVLTGQPVATAATEVGQVATTVAASLAATPATTALANPTIDISNPAIAAAIAAYHMVDGLFDTAWPHDEGMAIETKGYTEIWPVGEIRAVRLDLYV